VLLLCQEGSPERKVFLALNRGRAVMAIKRREYMLIVRGIECSKCSQSIRGKIWIDLVTLDFTASSGFRIYTDGIICSSCDGSASQKNRRSNIPKKMFREREAKAV